MATKSTKASPASSRPITPKEKDSKGKVSQSELEDSTLPKPSEVWGHSSKNTQNSLSNLNYDVEISKYEQVESKPSWQEDYIFICAQYGTIPCPFISATISESSTLLRIRNCTIDLPSWRACLLTFFTLGSNVVELSLHNLQLTPQHINDLSLAMARCRSCKILKLEFIDFGMPDSLDTFSSSFQSLISNPMCFEFLSLRGCRLGDAFLGPLLRSLSSNFTLQALNLSDNLLTDQTLFSLLQSLRLNYSLEVVSLARNLISGEGEGGGESSLDALESLLLGSPSLPEDEALVKAVVKQVGERNKKTKELNKRLKKAGRPELEELPSPKDVLFKMNGVNSAVNRNLQCLDLSFNPLSGPGPVLAVGSRIKQREAEGKGLRALGPRPTFTLKVKGSGGRELGSENSDCFIVES